MSSETSICQAKKVLFKKKEKEAQSHLNPLTRRSHQAAGSVMLLSCEAPELPPALQPPRTASRLPEQVAPTSGPSHNEVCPIQRDHEEVLRCQVFIKQKCR